ncbi:3-phosphoshikimate 1-carboxyvinyltransferase [Flavobacterium sp.]
MDLKLQKSAVFQPTTTIEITGSKSETNRLLLLQALYSNLVIKNISICDDADVMVNALQNLPQKIGNSRVVDVHHAGTAMRFLTAYYAIQEDSEVLLTGSSRMKQRPIKILVDALKQLGADIVYTEKEGFPPLRIQGKKFSQNTVALPANVSSQYISALLLIGAKLQNGLQLELEDHIASKPYLEMTITLLKKIGIETSYINNKITVNQTSKIDDYEVKIESDWSSASYFYSIIALSPIKTKIKLSNFKEKSLQGDAGIVDIYNNFGVQTTFINNEIIVEKISQSYQSVRLNLVETPDLAQTIAVTAFGLGLGCRLTGLETLKIKETDRIQALKNELTKLGALIISNNSALIMSPSTRIKENINIKTYDDHRMAMAFAPLALKTNLIIENSEVVSKSYPNFWNDLKDIGFKIN